MAFLPSFERFLSYAGLVVLTIRRNSRMYFPAFVTVEAILSVVQILVVAELFSLVVRGYRGIARTGRWFLWVALGVAVGLSLLLNVSNVPSNPNQLPFL